MSSLVLSLLYYSLVRGFQRNGGSVTKMFFPPDQILHNFLSPGLIVSVHEQHEIFSPSSKMFGHMLC